MLPEVKQSIFIAKNMKNTLLIFLLLTGLNNYAQNVGIGNSSPTEKLDVTGNINVTGTIKANGTDGAPNQVLMKNTSGDLAWGDPAQFKNFVTFYNTSTYNIPAGVTKIMVELWGAGGGGNLYCAGGGGGYAKIQLDVTPGAECNIEIGSGGIGVIASNGADGGASYFSIGGASFTCLGGRGATSTSATSYGPGLGGTFTSGGSTRSYVVVPGTPGGTLTKRYEQSNATTFLEITEGGAGGTAFSFPGNGGTPHHLVYNQTSATTVLYTSGGKNGRTPGGGGASGIVNGAANVTGGTGGAAMAMIHF